jgi:nucleoid DNA-binding protein
MATATKRDLVNQISVQTGLTQIDAKIVVEELLSTIGDVLSENKNIEIRGFGTFIPKERKPRPARNIRTGEVVPLKKRIVPIFRYSAELKKKVDNALKGGEVKSIFTVM